MGISTQTITVDLSKQLTRPQVVRLGQGDKSGTTLVADIYDNGAAYSLNGKTARFSMRAPDGRSSYSVVASSYSGNKATFDLDETYAASIAGKTDTAYIEVLSGSTVICSTSRITVVVYRSASQGLPVAGAYSDAISEAIDTFAEMQRAFADMQRAFADMQELVMPPATTSTLGGVIVGEGLNVASDGTLSFEAGDHSHNASDITDGTLAVARGGTGVTTAAAERERLGLGSTTGVLPIANGGTGAADAATALTNLGAASAADLETVEDMVELLPVANGGTGATTASDARTNLSVYSKAEVGQNYATKTEVGQKADSSTVLYNNTSGSNGTITLSESSANYNHMRIYLRTDDGAAYVSSYDVHSPDGKYALLSAAKTTLSQSSTWLKTRTVYISGTSITTDSTSYATTNVTASGEQRQTNNVYITRVEAWNE